MVVMLRRPSHQIAPAVASCMHLTDKPEFGQYIERTVHRDKPDAGVFLMHLFVYGSGCEMVMAERDYIQHSPPLRRDLVALLSQ